MPRLANKTPTEAAGREVNAVVDELVSAIAN
jgi:hypothetical protein